MPKLNQNNIASSSSVLDANEEEKIAFTNEVEKLREDDEIEIANKGATLISPEAKILNSNQRGNSQNTSENKVDIIENTELENNKSVVSGSISNLAEVGDRKPISQTEIKGAINDINQEVPEVKQSIDGELASSRSDVNLQNPEGKSLNGSLSVDLLPPIKTINLSVFKSEEIARNKDLAIVELLTLPISESFKRFEIGIGSAFYASNPFKSIVLEDFENEFDEFSINNSYFNGNVYFTARIKRQWSLSSGIYYTNQNFDLAYSISQVYVINDQENQLDTYLDLNNSDNSFGFINPRGTSNEKVSIIGEEATINFLPDANLRGGDQLNITGRVPLNVKITTFPLQLNYHLYYRKFEYTLFSGFSLNHLKFSLDELPITIYKGTQLVANEVLTEAISQQIVLPNFILGGGIKYHIDKKWNASIAYNLNPIAISFSKVYMGVNYSF